MTKVSYLESYKTDLVQTLKYYKNKRLSRKCFEHILDTVR